MMALSDTDSVVELGVEKKINQYIKKQEAYVGVSDKAELPITEKVIDFPENIKLDDFYYVENNVEEVNIQTSFDMPVTEDFTLNGAVKLNVSFTATAPQVPVHVFVAITDGMTTLETGWRTGFVTGNKIGVVEEKSLTFPLMNAEVPAGAVITVYLATVDGSVFYRQPEVREFFTPMPDQPATVTILTGEEHNTQLIFPVEI